MKKASRPGKPFYATILLFSIFLLAVSAVSLFIGLNAINIMGEQARSNMIAALEVNMDYMGVQRQETSLAELAASLDTDGLLTRMGASVALDGNEVEEMEGRLNALREGFDKDFPNDIIVPYLYFQRSDYAMGYEAPGADVRGVIGNLILESVVNLSKETKEYSDTRLLRQESPDPLSVRVRLVAENVYFFYVTYGTPTTAISSQLLDALYKPEMYYYDRYGNAGPCQSETSLMHLYDYYSLGSAQSGSFSFLHEGTVYNCLYDQVPDSETRFAVFAVDQAHQAKQALLKSILLLIGLLLFFGIIVVFIFARRMYKPIHNLVGGLTYEEKGGIRDDFLLLGEALASKDSAIASQRERLIRVEFLRLLQGDGVSQNQEAEETFFFYDVNATLAVAAFRTDDGEPGEVARIDVAHVEAFFKAQNTDAACAYDGRLMICTFDTGKRDLDALIVLLEDLRTKLGEKIGTTVSAFLSGVHAGGPEALRIAYVEVLQLAEFCAMLEKYDTVLNYSSMRKHLRFNCGNVLDYELLHKLTCAITELCEEDALELFDRISQRITLCKETSHPVGALCLSILRNSIALALHDVALYGETTARVTTQYEQEIFLAGSLQRLREVLKQVLAVLSEHVARLKSDSGRFEQINSYIMEHYLEPYLNAGAVADAFEMSPSNITRLFKKYKRTGFLEYVNTLRVEKAKSLLNSTNYTLAEISVMVGYTNTVTMTRAFKRCTGTTPGNFRKESAVYN